VFNSFPPAQQTVVGHGLLIVETSQSHSVKTLGRTHLDEWSIRLRDLFLSIHNIYKRRTSTLPVGLEPSVPGSEWLQIHEFDCAATRIGTWCSI